MLLISHKFTCVYKSSTNGRVETLNARLVNLTKYVENDPKQWSYYLPLATFAWNVTVQQEQKESPFMIIFAKMPILPRIYRKTSQSPFSLNIRSDYV